MLEQSNITIQTHSTTRYSRRTTPNTYKRSKQQTNNNSSTSSSSREEKKIVIKVQAHIHYTYSSHLRRFQCRPGNRQSSKMLFLLAICIDIQMLYIVRYFQSIGFNLPLSIVFLSSSVFFFSLVRSYLETLKSIKQLKLFHYYRFYVCFSFYSNKFYL